MSQDSRTFEVIDISYAGAVAAHALFDGFCHFIRLIRTIDDTFVKRRHRTCYVISQRCLTAFGIPDAIFTDQFCQKANDEPEEHLPFSFEVHSRLHAIQAGHAPFTGNEAAHETTLPGRRQFFRAGVAVLGDSDDAFSRADDIIGADNIFCIFFYDIDDVIFICQYSGLYRY